MAPKADHGDSRRGFLYASRSSDSGRDMGISGGSEEASFVGRHSRVEYIMLEIVSGGALLHRRRDHLLSGDRHVLCQLDDSII